MAKERILRRNLSQSYDTYNVRLVQLLTEANLSFSSCWDLISTSIHYHLFASGCVPGVWLYWSDSSLPVHDLWVLNMCSPVIPSIADPSQNFTISMSGMIFLQVQHHLYEVNSLTFLEENWALFNYIWTSPTFKGFHRCMRVVSILCWPKKTKPKFFRWLVRPLAFSLKALDCPKFAIILGSTYNCLHWECDCMNEV